jgi:hypothetical protein
MAVLGFFLGLGLRMSQDKNSTGGVNDFQSTVSAVGVVVIVALSKAEGAAAANHFFSSRCQTPIPLLLVKATL